MRKRTVPTVVSDYTTILMPHDKATMNLVTRPAVNVYQLSDGYVDKGEKRN